MNTLPPRRVVARRSHIRLRGGDLAFLVIIYALLALFFAVTLYPMLFVLSASVSDPKAVAAGRMVLLPVGITTEGYKFIFQYKDLWTGYANTLFYTVAGTMLSLAVTLPCAYALSRPDLVGRGGIMALFLFTMYFSGGLIPIYLNMQSLGLINTRAVLLVSGMLSVFNLIVSRTFFANSIPWELHEAARIDGCGDFMTFLRIVLPLSKPIIVVMCLYYGVAQWNQYFAAMIYLRDRELFPLQLFLREILIQSKFLTTSLASSTDAAEVAALLKQQDVANLLKYGVIVVSTVPMLVVYPWLQQYFAKGVMIGSVKG